MGWKIVGTINPEIKKCVMMVMPHTSAHDFYLGILGIAIFVGIPVIMLIYGGIKILFKIKY